MARILAVVCPVKRRWVASVSLSGSTTEGPLVRRTLGVARTSGVGGSLEGGVAAVSTEFGDRH